MKKILLLLLFLFTLTPLAYSEEFPPSGQGIDITKETNPIYFGYMEDYAEKLKEAFTSKHLFWPRGVGASCKYFVTRDGEIRDMNVFPYRDNYYNKKVRKIIASVPPLPFREGMNLDEMQFSVYLGFENYDDIDLGVGCDKNKIKVFIVDVVVKK